MYQRTPVVYSVRAAPLRYPVFYGESHTLISYDAGQHRLDWRNWRSGRVTRSVNLPEIQDQTAISYVSADGSKVLLFAPRTFVLYLLDCSQMSVHRIRDQRPLVPLGMTSTRLLTLTRLENHTAEITLWDITQGDPTRITTLPTVGHEWTARFEISEKYGLAVENGGELFLLDAESGIMLLHRSAAEQPRYCRAHSRGTPGEFILAGMTHIGRIDMTRGSAIEILDPVTKMPFVGRARSLATTPGSNRMVLIMTDQRVGVGQSDQNPIRGEYIPSLTASAASLSRDGRHVALRSPVAHRMFIFDLQGDSPRRLHMRSELASPLGTLFAVEFSPDSRRLMAGAMTGDIECFDITTGDSWPVVGAPIAGGVTRLCTAGGDLFVGTHELGQRNARVLRVRDGQSEVLTGGDLGHIAGLQADDANLWVLAGCGTLSRFDLRVGKAQARAKIPDLAGGAGVGRALARLPEYGVLIVSWSGDGLAVLDETTFNMLCTATVGAPRDIAVSPVDPTLVATSGEDGLIRLWRYRPGAKPRLEEFMTFGAHAGDTFTLTFSPDGRFLASGGGTVEARDVRIWSVAEGRQLAALDLFEQSVFGLAFSPDGRWLAAAGESGEEQDEGCQLYLIELHAPDRCIAGNLEYHIARFVQKYGHEPSQAATLRKWAGAIPKNHPQ
jgi:WD40 repeat protein